MIPLTQIELAALQAVKVKYGRTWKSKLRLAWERCNYRELHPDLKPILHHLRNKIGASGLDKVELSAKQVYLQ